MATQTRRANPPVNRPELKIGPFQGGIGVAVWLNEIQTEAGCKLIRSITLSPRRYLDRQTNEWKDAESYRPGDLTALILGLEKAREYCLTTELPGEHSVDDRMTGVESSDFG